jgi:peptidoglycan/LPS O-acetylase OafA/YrhL
LERGVPAHSTGRAPTAQFSRIDALDAIRVLACVSVVIAHSPLWPGRFGGHGVTMFMVLSGFVITLLLRREWEWGSTVDVRAFWARRLLRLVPAYFAYVAFVMLIDLARGRTWSLGLLGATMTFTVNYYNAVLGHPPSPVAHTWSLSVEQQFYLVWPLVFLAVRPWGRSRLVRVLVATIVAVALWRSILFFQLGASMSWIWNAFETRADALAMGCLLAVCWEAPVVQRVSSALGRWSWTPVPTLALIVASRSLVLDPAWQMSLGITVTAALAVVLVAQMGAIGRRGESAWGHPVVRYLGRITYGSYLFHALALDAAEKLPLGVPAQVVVAILLTFATGAVVHEFVERPTVAIYEQWRTGGRVPTPLPLPIPRITDAYAVAASRVASLLSRYLRRAA